MNKSSTILHITPFFSPNIGGVETHLENLTEYLRSKNYKQIVITYQALVGLKKGEKKEISKNLEIYRLSWISGLYYKTLVNPLIHFLYLTPWLLINVWLFLLGRSKDVSLIHAHGINASFTGAIVKFLFGKPLVTSLYVEFNFNKNNWMTNFYIWPLNRSNKILVMTERSKQELVRCGIDEAKIVVYSHWVNQDVFTPVSRRNARLTLGIKENKFTVLFVGRLTKEKGTYLLLNIAKGLPEIQFIVIASGDLLDTFKIEASRLKNIVYTGRVEYDKLPIYYQVADLLIVPSLVLRNRSTFGEGIPRVIMEALSCGTPVIATDNGGIKEVVERGRVGIIVPSKASDFIDNIRKLSKDSVRVAGMEKRCIDYAKERFNIKGAEIIINSYQHAVS